MNLDKHTLTEKKYYKARKELDKINDQISALPYSPIAEPYQSGWWLIITLREDIAKSAKGDILTSIVQHFQEKTVTNNPKYVSEIRKKPGLTDVMSLMTSKGRFHYYSGPCMKSLSKKEYDKLTPAYQKYFSYNPWVASRRYDNQPYEFNVPLFYLQVKTKQRIVTHVKDINPALEKEEARLRKILEPYYRTSPAGYGYYHWRENRQNRRASHVESHLLAKQNKWESLLPEFEEVD